MSPTRTPWGGKAKRRDNPPWPDGRRKWQSWIDKIYTNVHPIRDPIGEASLPGIGQVYLGYLVRVGTGEIREVGLSVPSLIVQQSPEQQLLEIALRLEGAGVHVVVIDGVLYPVWVTDAERVPEVIGLETSCTSLGSGGSFPWHWMLTAPRHWEPWPVRHGRTVRSASQVRDRLPLPDHPRPPGSLVPDTPIERGEKALREFWNRE